MLTIYGIPISVHVRKTILTALMKGVAFKIEPVIPFNPPPGWDGLSPTGLIPAATDGELAMADSAVICRYIDLSNPNPPIYPAKTGDLMQALYLEAYAGGEIFGRLVRPLFHQKIIGPMMFNRPTDQAEVELLMSDVQPKIFSYLESQAQRKFLAGDALSIGDISVASNLINYQYLGLRIDPGRHPRLANYMEGIVRVGPLAEALAAEAPFADKMGLDRTFLN